MARATYGGTLADGRTTEWNAPETQAAYYLWTLPSLTQGVRITDFIALGNNTVTGGVGNTGPDTRMWFQGPDNYTDAIYASATLGGARAQVGGPDIASIKAFIAAQLATATSAGATDSGVAALVNGAGATHAAVVNLVGTAAGSNLASPALTGTPTAPTAAAGTATTQLATTAFVATGLAAKGPSVGSTAWLQTWGAAIDSLVVGLITRNGDGAATSASVVWPDGTPGAYVGTPSNVTPGAIDSYAVTYAPTGGTTKTVTQPLLTRDPNGYVTARPAMTVA